jgi:hypothetical protein
LESVRDAIGFKSENPWVIGLVLLMDGLKVRHVADLLVIMLDISSICQGEAHVYVALKSLDMEHGPQSAIGHIKLPCSTCAPTLANIPGRFLTSSQNRSLSNTLNSRFDDHLV